MSHLNKGLYRKLKCKNLEVESPVYLTPEAMVKLLMPLLFYQYNRYSNLIFRPGSGIMLLTRDK